MKKENKHSLIVLVIGAIFIGFVFYMAFRPHVETGIDNVDIDNNTLELTIQYVKGCDYWDYIHKTIDICDVDSVKKSHRQIFREQRKVVRSCD